MKKYFALPILLLWATLSGCTTVNYNGARTIKKYVNTPPIGKVVTVYVGDPMLRKAELVEAEVLDVHKTIHGAFYIIPAGNYLPVGFDDENYYFSASGATRNSGWADPIQALALGKKPGAELCVVTTFGAKECYKGDYERKLQLASKTKSFEQRLIYSGRVGNTITIGYREFTNDLARPAFSNNAQYDLTSSKIIGYKGAELKVIKADNSSITYKVLRSFP